MQALVEAVRPLAAASSAATADVLNLVSAANEACAGSFGPQLAAIVTRDDKRMVLQYATEQLRTGEARDADVPAWLGLLKIFARTQTDLDPLYAKEFVLALASYIQAHAADGANTADRAANAAGVAILSQSLRLLLNLCIVDKDRVHQAFGCAPQRNVPLFGKIAEPAASSSDGERKYPEIEPLVAALTRTVNTPAEPDAVFFFVRILVFVLVRVPLARAAIEHASLYETLLSLFLRVSSSMGVQLRDSSAASSSSSSTPASSAATDDHAANLKLSTELMTLLSNTSLVDELPTCHAHLTAQGKEALYDAYLTRVTAILAHGVEVPEECAEGYAGDPIANAAVGTMMPATLPKPTVSDESDAATVALGDVSLAEPPSTNSASASSSSSTAQFPSAPAQPPATFVPVQRQQTRIILALMTGEAPENAAFVQLQRDASHLLLGADGSRALPLLEADSCRAFHGLVQLLHRALILAGANKKDGEVLLSPIISTLSGLVHASPTLRAHAKRCIFLDLASPPALVNGVPYKKADATNYAMSPAGAVSEKLTDADPLSLKSLLLQWVITLNFNLKQTVSEFLYRVCAEDTSEYIRLLGFGNAVGLLAEKGLPGFSMLGKQAINMDDVLKSGKKL